MASYPAATRVFIAESKPLATARPGYLRLPVRLREGMASFADPGRATRLGVAGGYPTSLAALPAVRERLALPRGDWPGADQLVRTLVTLPTHSRVDAATKNELVRLVEKASVLWRRRDTCGAASGQENAPNARNAARS